MKVLIINDYAATIGGAERFLENLLYESQHAAIDFHRLNITDLVQGSGSVAWSNVITDRMKRIRVIPEMVSWITHQVELIKPDLIHLNNNHLYTNSVVHSLRSSGIPVVWFVHDECTLRRMRSVFYLQTNNSFTFLTHSPQIYNGLTSMQRKAYLVKVPFNHTKWTLPPEEVIRHRSSDILYVGRIEKSKGIFTLVKAVDLIKEKVSSINLTILGDGSQLKALESMVKARKLTSGLLECRKIRSCAGIMPVPESLYFLQVPKHWDTWAWRHRLAGRRSSPLRMKEQSAGAGTTSADLLFRARPPKNSLTKYWKSSMMT